MDHLEVTWWRATKIWWGIFWRGLLWSMVVGLPLGFLIGIVCALVNFREGILPLARLSGLVIGIPIGIWATKLVMEKRFSDFRIVLVPSFESMLDKEKGAGR